jgi:outer membrane protein OmpA-like peptidoglycan-associated protein
MSDEKPPVDDELPAQDHGRDAADAAARPAVVSFTITPAVGLMFLIVVLLVVLLLINNRRGGVGMSSDDPAVAALRADLEARRGELNRQRIALGLPPLEGGSEPVEDIAGRLKKDADTLVALATRFQEMLAEKDLEISGKNAELIRSEQNRQLIAAESARLQEELRRALVGGGEVDQLRREVTDQKARRDAMAAELANLREQLAAANSQPSADLEVIGRRLEETGRARDFFENRTKQLEAEIARLRIFAKSEDELLPAAVQLFRGLRELEDLEDSDLTTAYGKLGDSLGASVLHTLDFATGSSELSEDDQEAIRGLVDEIPDGDLVLVVGYASQTGGVDDNRRLSSARATAAAESFSAIKRPDQLVQAVYLGQTDRYSGEIPERNQVCEIWRIRKMNDAPPSEEP